jgi:N-acetylglucosaminyldiphosphoundecaprenol N-acetyl-beta-D-mannosaminyltransferase
MRKELIQGEKFATIRCLDYDIFTDTLSKISFKDKLLINTVNQYSLCIAEKDNDFKSALKRSDILLPDGVSIVLAARILCGETIKKIAGADLHNYILTELNKFGGSCFYLGSSEDTLSRIKEKISTQYAQIKLGAYSPPFKQQFNEEDTSKMLNAINAFNPDVLFVGMTAPKQEKWTAENRDLINANVICSIGAVFDFYADTVKRPKQIWINMGLEWLVRLVKEPKRLRKRYLYYGPLFIIIIVRKWFNSKRTSNSGNGYCNI